MKYIDIKNKLNIKDLFYLFLEVVNMNNCWMCRHYKVKIKDKPCRECLSSKDKF